MLDEFIFALQEAQLRIANTREALTQLGKQVGSELIPSADLGENGLDQSQHSEAVQANPQTSPAPTLSRSDGVLPAIASEDIYIALLQLSPTLADSYAQIKMDVQDKKRLSFGGTAHEIRQVLSSILHLLAPTEKVLAASWYKQESNTSGPTQKQRVHYILEQRGAGSKEREVATHAARLEEMIEDLVRDTYSRASDAAHSLKDRQEAMRILKYFEAFANDLLHIG